MIQRKEKETKKFKIQNKNNFYFFIITFLFLIDIITKYLFEDKIYFENNFLHIISTHNSGSAFGIFSNIFFYNQSIALLGLICIGLLIYHKSDFISNKKMTIVWILILAGILGNSFDRLIYGYTRDFLGFGEFFIFNMADFYLTIAVILYFIYEFEKIKK